MWCDIISSHEIEQLAWQFLKRLFRKQVRVMLEFIERNELDNISRHVLAVSRGVECFIVGIKCVHTTEICVTYTNNDDSKG